MLGLQGAELAERGDDQACATLYPHDQANPPPPWQTPTHVVLALALALMLALVLALVLARVLAPVLALAKLVLLPRTCLPSPTCLMT